MEGTNQPPGSRMQGAPFGSLDLHGNSMETHAPNLGKQIFINSQIPGTLTMNRASEPDDFPGFQFKEDGRSDKNHHQHSHHSKNGLIDDEGHYMTEDATNTPSVKGKKASMWHRMKWTDSMVKLLITAVSYTGDDHGADLGGGRRNSTIMQKKGKWKAISKVMGERDCHVSPQQCEDKFNDLNKRYKRLIDILGRGTACDVVEKPELLDSMNHLSDKMKDDVKKLLNSKQLFFEEMCSYHNNNRRKLPEDHALQHSLLLALRCKEDHDPLRDASGDADEDDQSADSDHEENDDEEQHPVHTNMREPSMDKRARHGDAALLTSSSHEGIKRSDPHGITVDINKAFPDGTNWALLQQDLASQSLEVRKRLLQIEEKNLELKKQCVKWERFRKKKDREIERMAMENEHMMIENKQLELELRQKELELELKLKGQANHA
ncbi:hypothetical protein SETIT_8G043200v2 [Setaria italica]|uniref:Myb/SANT-like DNA-binding domain-containing protein n=1 Tax=Setaria italica TaxID=4555 RepID=K3ZII9_SETIT|nr:uncharacterized protein LOC101780231 [Setaria italica]XP_004978761.1 uncharacterized protein LOC101780231 [Setaria italica]XP_022684636.1 uncharacterized protein LOC101780231 [Setaria italica]XP_022684637.1 uncharacterized protein LOC101780231 [Setaria italica]XP_022684638.1 uncharacterized protein LOC101780231 [Setaria italica]RCV37191.1 hypothetical protein SETIT_8G043200v2 [Setaria italica]